jgi:hypothetical protein
MSAAIDLITDAAGLAGILGVGETMTADEAADSLRLLNDVLDLWSAGDLWNTANTTLQAAAGQAVYTIGSGGQWDTVRPVRIAGAYCTYSGVDFPIRLIDQAEYNGISIKAQRQPIVERLLYVNEVPLGLVTLWPVPAENISITLSIENVADAVAGLTANISLPPGAGLAIKGELAALMAVKYGRDLPPQVAALGAKAKADYRRANNPLPPSMGFDPALASPGAPLWQRGW